MQEDGQRRIARTVALSASAVAAMCLAYMSALAAIDWRASRDLASPAARAYASRVCARVIGCEELTIAPGFDWRRGARTVLYRVEVGLREGFEPRSALAEIRLLAASPAAPNLRWALRAEPVLLSHRSANASGRKHAPGKDARP